MIIECENDIVLRSISEADTDNIIKWRNSPAVVSFFNYQKEVTKEEHVDWLNTKVRSGEVRQFIICDKALSKDIGSVYLKNIDKTNKKAEFGIFIGETDGIGRGLGTVTAKAMADFAFNTLGLHRLYLQVHADNTRAIRSYEKAGFTREAVLRDDVFVNGGYCDIIIMGIINNEV